MISGLKSWICFRLSDLLWFALQGHRTLQTTKQMFKKRLTLQHRSIFYSNKPLRPFLLLMNVCFRCFLITVFVLHPLILMHSWCNFFSFLSLLFFLNLAVRFDLKAFKDETLSTNRQFSVFFFFSLWLFFCLNPQSRAVQHTGESSLS